MIIITLKKDEYIGNIYVDNPKHIIGQNAIDYGIDCLLKHTDKIRTDCYISYGNKKWKIVLKKHNKKYELSNLSDEDVLNLITKVEIVETSLQEYFYVDDALIPEINQIIKNIKESNKRIFDNENFKVEKYIGGSFDLKVLYYGFEKYPLEERSNIVRDLFWSRLKDKSDIFRIFFYDASWENY